MFSLVTAYYFFKICNQLAHKKRFLLNGGQDVLLLKLKYFAKGKQGSNRREESGRVL